MPAEFDRRTMNIKELREQPVDVITTEINSLAKSLGVSPAELFRTLNPGATDAAGLVGTRPGLEEQCCHSDGW